MNITNVYAYEIFDSRGLPTIECCIYLANGKKVTASAPSGASVGKQEALELRDNDITRFAGKGVLQAVAIINDTIAPKFIGQPINALAMDSILMDLDTHPQKITIGANTTIAVSMALFKAQAAAENIELFELIQRVSGTNQAHLPTPMFNMINGGAHANNNLAIQEFMIVPTSKNYTQALHDGVTFYQHLKKSIDTQGLSTSVGDEGGFAPNLSQDTAALELLMSSIKELGLQNYAIALDVAASQFYDEATKTYHLQQEKNLSSLDLITLYESLCKQYPIMSIEDGLDENDTLGWQKLTLALGEQIKLVGDDIFVTSPMKIRKGVLQKIANAVLIKPNQIGTVSQTLAAIDVCKNKNLTIVISHRSGETNDTFIADLAVGVAADFIKAGAPCRGERLSKYNRLLEIDRMINAE
ncbi:phosphopyruvate hydratase [Candidatus Chromulinivorax destructor]|uniref:Enolase n=1 Tax=Candidatus Chromulinivorax destructor TaxID=2066483 RepID=A0A345ZC18_9BACT|nr:phosphopyruvate hydratase [Candidatus Chromulinivorax destructor]AXK60835.1 phosphopyruvate hydratase [Candidatus Chromulinivorax destructor]